MPQDEPVSPTPPSAAGSPAGASPPPNAENPAPRQPGRISALLRAISEGNTDAFDEVFPLVYTELSTLAAHRLRFERPDHTLNTTALVHEVYLKLVDQTRAGWHNRHQFYAVASEAMRRILIDHAKQRQARKRGDGAPSLPLDAADRVPADGTFGAMDADDLVALDAALTRLAAFNPQGARIIQYRFFGGLSNDEIAELLGTSERSVRRSWTVAKGWLRRELGASLDRSASHLAADRESAT